MKPLVLAELAQNSQTSSLWSWSLPRYLAENETKDKKGHVPFDCKNYFAEEVAEQKLAQLCSLFSCAWRVLDWQSLFILAHPQSRRSLRGEAITKDLPSSITLRGQFFSTGLEASSRWFVQCRPCQSQQSSLPPEAVAWGHACSPPACFTSGGKSMGAAVPGTVTMQLGFVSASWCLLICG